MNIINQILLYKPKIISNPSGMIESHAFCIEKYQTHSKILTSRPLRLSELISLKDSLQDRELCMYDQ
jgi:hypothetical protein